jgi:predicted transcriptional regulator
MLSTVELLDLAKRRQGDVTDYRIAKFLGVSTQNVSNYRTGRNTPKNPIAMRLGALAGVDPLEAVAAVNLERATSEEDREVWQSMLQRLSASGKQNRAS